MKISELELPMIKLMQDTNTQEQIKNRLIAATTNVAYATHNKEEENYLEPTRLRVQKVNSPARANNLLSKKEREIEYKTQQEVEWYYSHQTNVSSEVLKKYKKSIRKHIIEIIDNGEISSTTEIFSLATMLAKYDLALELNYSLSEKKTFAYMKRCGLLLPTVKNNLVSAKGKAYFKCK
ncbi:MAG: hypothetical protein RR406_00935 [Bacilli bacterium]